MEEVNKYPLREEVYFLSKSDLEKLDNGEQLDLIANDEQGTKLVFICPQKEDIGYCDECKGAGCGGCENTGSWRKMEGQ